jgi:hypothetical protein
MRRHVLRRLAWSLWAGAMVLAAFGGLLLILNWGTPVPPSWGFRGFPVLFALAFSTVGALIASHRPQHRIGWLFCAFGFACGIQAFTAEYAIFAVLTRPDISSGGQFAAWLANWIWIPDAGLITIFLPLWFPTGSLLSPHWRPVAWLAAVAIGVWTVAVAFMPGPIDNFAFITNPFGIERGGEFLLLAQVSGALFFLTSMGASVISLIIRFRRSRLTERQQIKWLAYAATFVALALALSIFPPPATIVDRVISILVIVAFVMIPIAVGIAILRYRLYDIDILIARTLVYVPLTMILAAMFSIAQQVLKQFFTTFWGEQTAVSTVLTTLIIVALFEPLKKRIERLVEKYTKKIPDPAHTVKVFRDKIQSRVLRVNTETITEELLEEVVLGFGATSGAVYLDGRDPEQPVHATRNWKGTATLTIPLRSAEDRPPLGALVLGAARTGGEYSERQRGMLQEMAQIVAAAIEQDQPVPSPS